MYGITLTAREKKTISNWIFYLLDITATNSRSYSGMGKVYSRFKLALA
jgi:hypothetical protein